MNIIVPRTCIEVSQGNQNENPNWVAKPLESFRSSYSYVLLGDPGSGKSTAFEVEAEAAGENAELLSARDFITFNADRHQKWRDKTLFIDGLDEVRVSSGEKREALDKVRRQLDDLGRPRFRISCREADWLGHNDLKGLAVVSTDHSIQVIRLNPLTNEDVWQILNAHTYVNDPTEFMAEAQRRGVDRLLENPLTLDMLAKVVKGGKAWPTGRLETFTMFCQQMATESNEEHKSDAQLPDVETLIRGAGWWCTHYLIAGAAGCSIDYHEPDTNYIAPGGWAEENPETARYALGTRLFKSVGARHFLPVHRHVAEFLGAWHLAHLVNRGLPIGRVLAMVTASDGKVVTEFRGLCAWLAAHCPAARARLIECDPAGVALYGDLRVFEVDDKRRLLSALDREVAHYSTEFSTFDPLTAPEMELVLEEFLNDERRDYDRQHATEFLLRILSHSPPLARLSTTLRRIIFDETRWPVVSKCGLQAFINNAANPQARLERLKSTFADVVDKQKADPSRDLLEALLPFLNPQEIPPLEIWEHFAAGGIPDAIVEHLALWEDSLLQESTDSDLGECLDFLGGFMPELEASFRADYLNVAPVRLLVRTLQALGDQQEPARLYNWLSAAAYMAWYDPRITHESTEAVRDWLVQRPAVQKAVLLEGLARCPDDEDFERCAEQVPNRLHHSTAPPDFRSWCLNKAAEWADHHGGVADFLLRYAVYLGKNPTTESWITREVLKERIRGHPDLEQRLSELLEEQDQRPTTDWSDVAESASGKKDQSKKHLVDYVRANIDLLRQNRAAPELLHEIGKAYFGFVPYALTRTTSGPRLSSFLPFADLLEASTEALIGTIHRPDVPGVSEIIRRAQNECPHPLSLPFLAGLQEICRVDRDQLDHLQLAQIQQAIAFHYCVSTDEDSEPEWLIRLMQSRPEMIADVLVQCAVAISSGAILCPGFYEHGKRENYATVASYACLPLLKEYPHQQQGPEHLESLDQLLWSALLHSDKSALQMLIEDKLSCPDIPVAQRIRWLAAGVFLAPDTYRKDLETTVAGEDDRIREMAAFFAPEEEMALRIESLDVTTIQTMIRLMGGVFEPEFWVDPDDIDWRVSERLETLMEVLSFRTGENASRALDDLVGDDSLVAWRVELENARGQQRLIHRDASYNHPSVLEARQTLSNQEPSNAGDLTVLLTDKLNELATRIRTANTDDWRQYWNEDSQGRPGSPKREVHCRDALLSDLRGVLPAGVAAEPEGEYANDKRADIRVTFRDFNVPVEVKKDHNQQLWSSLQDQLIARYTSDPATGGHGIYLVFWFGGGAKMPLPPHGQRPVSPVELKEQLEAQLATDDKLRISVCVVDVSPLN